MSCLETFATLRIFSDDVSPHVITKTLDIEPTESFAKGDAYSQGRYTRKSNGWFWSTKGRVISTNNAEHIGAVLSKLAGKHDGMRKLTERGCHIDITNYWVSTGQGGPTLEPEQMRILSSMNIAIWWDVYFNEPEGDES